MEDKKLDEIKEYVKKILIAIQIVKLRMKHLIVKWF